MKTLFVTLLLLMLSSPGWTQTTEIKNMPGYVDFGSLESIYGEPKVMINITGVLIKLMAAAAVSSEEPEAAALMKGLQGIRVNVYNTGGDIDPALVQMQAAKLMLEKNQWQPFVQINEDREKVQMFTKIVGELMQGMAIMVVDAEEAVFINILGSLDPAQIGKVVKHLNIDVDVDADTE